MNQGLPEELFAALADESWRGRKEAVEQLLLASEGLGTGARVGLARRLLRELLATDVPHVRGAVQEVLLGLGDELAPLALEHLESRGENLRVLVDLLGRVGQACHVPALADIVEDRALDPNLRASAAAALGAIGGARAQAALEGLLADPDDLLRVYALDGLRAMGAQVETPKLAPLLAEAVTQRGALAVLGNSGDLRAIPVVLPHLEEGAATSRAEAAMTLVKLEEAARAAGQQALVEGAFTQLSEPARARVRELLAHSSTEVRIAAIRLATLSRDVGGVEAVVHAMDDVRAQEHALELVMELGDLANEALVEVAGRIEAVERAHLYRLIGALRVAMVDPRLQTMLVEGLEDPDEAAACAAAEALVQVGGRPALGPLYRVMGHDGPLGELAADALAHIVARLGGARHDDLNLLAGATWPHEGPLARNLCRVVGRLASDAYVSRLVSMLGSTDVGVRVAAAQALGNVPGEHEGVGALSFALADEEPQVRAAACRSLAAVAGPHGVQSLLSATKDPSPMVRATAVQAVVNLGNPVVLRRLREIVLEDPVPTVVVQAIAGLGASGSEHDLTLLMSLCTSGDHEVLKAAARALRAYPAHRATAALLGLLGHPRWDVRWAAAEVLGQRGDPTALDPLRAARAQEADDLVCRVLDDGIARLSAGRAEGGSRP